MIKILDRYLFKEMFFPFLMGILLLTFLMLLHQLVRLTEWVSDKGISLFTVSDLFVRMLPSFFLLTIPMATAFATILGFNRLSSDHELTALSASGIPLLQVFKSVFMFAIVSALLTLLMGNLSAHWGTSSFKSVAIKMLKERIGVGLETSRFTEIFPGLMLYAESIVHSTGVDSKDSAVDVTKLERVFIYDGRSSRKSQDVIVAQSGFLMSNDGVIGLELQEGAIHTHNRPMDQRIAFGTYSLKMRTPLPQTSVFEMERKDRDPVRAQIALYKKYSLAYASFLFCFLGIPLGMISGKGGRLYPFVAGIALIVLYYALYKAGDYFFPLHGSTPEWAAWVPNFVLTPMTIILFFLYANDIGFSKTRN
jgi:lipopolysaccharide export system permease protein